MSKSTTSKTSSGSKTSDFGKTILAAIDLEGDWSNVLAHALVHAKSAGASLQLVHVVENASASLQRSLNTKDLKAYQKRRREDAEARIADATKSVEAQGVKVMGSVLEGKPFVEILAVAEEMKAGLIVCGAGVTEGVEWLVIGTTPDRLIRNSTCPVLVVGAGAPSRLKRILVPTDLDRPDQGAIRLASKLAREHQGRVSILHVYAEPALTHFRMGDVASLRRELKANERKLFEGYVTSTALPAGCKPPHKLLEACQDKISAAETIVAEASRLNMDLIVMALGGISFLKSFVIGSTAEKIIRRLPCSLMALPTA